jgi:hypothetical protein
MVNDCEFRNREITVTLPGPGGTMEVEGGALYWETIYNEDIEWAAKEGKLQEFLERMVESYKRSLGFSLQIDGKPAGLALGWLDYLPAETLELLKVTGEERKSLLKAQGVEVAD